MGEAALTMKSLQLIKKLTSEAQAICKHQSQNVITFIDEEKSFIDSFHPIVPGPKTEIGPNAINHANRNHNCEL